MYNELGEDRFGIWVVMAGVATYFATFDLGFGAALSRHVALYEERRDRSAVRQLATLGFGLYVVVGILLLPLLMLVAEPLVNSLAELPTALEGEALHVLYWTYALVFATLAVGTFRGLLFGIHRSEVTVAADLAGQALYAVVLVVLLQRGLGLDAMIIASFVRLVPIVLVSLPVVRSHLGPLLTRHFRRAVVTDALAFSGWMQLNGVSTAVNLQTDRVVIGTFVSVSAVPGYEFANRIALLVRTFPLQLLSPLIPAAASQHARGDEAALRRTYVDGTRLIALMSLGLGGYMVAVAGPFLEVWLGDPQPNSTTVMVWVLVLAYVVSNLAGVGASVIRAVGEPRYESFWALGSALLNIAFTVALTPAFGIWGVIGGTLASTLVSTPVFLAVVHRRRGIAWRAVIDPLLRCLLAVGVVTVVTWGVVELLPASAFAGRLVGATLLAAIGLLYSALLLPAFRLTKALRHDELESARRWVRQRRTPPEATP
jgi:O-antigen/teichoic acid export membrane protein